MSIHTIYRFEELKNRIRANTPPIIYKYRADWKNICHKELITKQSIWFSAPSSLNDPYDIRTPLKFDYSEINHPFFFEKLKQCFIDSTMFNHLNEEELNILTEKRLAIIREDPQSYFEKNNQFSRDSNIHDSIGIFSCSTDGLNELMWSHYGNSSSGFAVGFKTIELWEDLKDNTTIGPVIYSDEIPLHSFIFDIEKNTLNTHFLKSKKWEYENEFRFYINGDSIDINRLRYFSKKSVAEFILGTNFPKNQITEITDSIRIIYGKDVPIFQAKLNVSSYGLIKISID